MRTVNEVSKLSGVSIRTLHYYDKIGLLKPTEVTTSGYRLYDDTALERLQNILLFRELQFPLKNIGFILDSPVFDRNKALEQQIELLLLKKEHLENLIDLARGIKMIGVKKLDFSVFDTKKSTSMPDRRKRAGGRVRLTKNSKKILTKQQERVQPNLWLKQYRFIAVRIKEKQIFVDVILMSGLSIGVILISELPVDMILDGLKTFFTDNMLDLAGVFGSDIFGHTKLCQPGG